MSPNILKKQDLVSVVIDAVLECGWNAICLNNSDPYELLIYNDDESIKVKLLIYNITHGGKSRSEDEYRIQIKETNISQEEGSETLLLGYYGELGVFAGFDVTKHTHAAYSASLQIRKSNLGEAYKNSFSLYKNTKDEIVVAFKPEFFINYVKFRNKLHEFGEFESEIDTLNEVVAENRIVNSEELDDISEKRKEVVYIVTKKLRESNFRERILVAYQYRCAICEVQLKLIEAAHILPVGFDDSTDVTSNGIALCPTHHRAYDKGLITFDEDYDILYNLDMIDFLKSQKLAGGIDKFIEDLNEKIVLPPNIHDRPHIDFIKTANQLRGW